MTAPDGRHTVDSLITEFHEKYLKVERRRPADALQLLRANLLHPEHGWKGRDARTIKPREVIELLDVVVARGAPAQANRLGSLLGLMFKFAIQRSIVEDSPVKLLMQPGGKETPRSRVLTDEELSAFLKNPLAATRFPRLAHAMTILLLTGQRRGELAKAKWARVNFDAMTWTIPKEDSKTTVVQVVPLSAWALEEFKRLKLAAQDSVWVLPRTDRTKHINPQLLSRALHRSKKRLAKMKIPAFKLHDLRRTCRTGLARLKIQPHIAERVIGHAQDKIKATYDLWEYFDEKKKALDQWAEHLHALVEPKP